MDVTELQENINYKNDRFVGPKYMEQNSVLGVLLWTANNIQFFLSRQSNSLYIALLQSKFGYASARKTLL